MHPYFVGLDVHKQVIAYCVKTAGGEIVMEGKIQATRTALDQWVKTLPSPWHGGLEATLFSHWIFRHLEPHAARRHEDLRSFICVTALETRHCLGLTVWRATQKTAGYGTQLDSQFCAESYRRSWKYVLRALTLRSGRVTSIRTSCFTLPVRFSGRKPRT